VSATDAPTIETAPEPAHRRKRLRRRAGVGAVAALGVVAAAIAVANPFDGSSGSSAQALDNGSPTSLATVERRSLSSQTQVSATLGYADSSTIVEPAGTPPSSVGQAEQTAASARAQLETARGTLAADRRALEQVRARLAAERLKAAVDCRGVNAAQASGASSSDSGGGNASACSTAAQAVSTDEQNLDADAAKVVADERSVSSARTALAAADESLAAARSSATVYGQSSIYTHLPAVGTVIRGNQTLFEIDGRPVVLLYGRVTAWRAFVSGMSPGRDVGELNANLGVGGEAFTAQTAAAIRTFQAAHGLEPTGQLLLGAVMFEPGPVRVTSVTPSRGATVQAGAVLEITSTRRQVEISLDAGQQADVKVGDPVTITLPDNTTTPGRVAFVGSVATAPSDSSDANGSRQSPTIDVHVTPTEPAATGRLDQAPVSVSITTATVVRALVVPVNALLALSGGGYAVEEVAADGTHRLVPVELGLFDDADGLVQVTGSGLAAGQRIVVPAQ
jgi:peptidoglycan hydrolase-like protein with peptidoglycan-binding domain